MIIQSIKPCLFLVWLLLASFYNSKGQSLEANHWYFGYGSGMVFHPNGPKVNIHGVHRSIYAVASVSDSNGNLLFYADQKNIYNSKHDTLIGGNEILNSENLLIIKQPNSNHLYWLISLEEINIYKVKCNYFVIDVQQEKVVNQGVFPGVYENKGMSVLNHSNGEDKWLVLKQDSSSYFSSFLMNQSGFDFSNPSISSISWIGTDANIFMKSSPNSKMICLIQGPPVNSMFLAQFNGTSGRITKKVYSESFLGYNTRGYCAFSASSDILFLPIENKLWAFNVHSLDSNTIANLKILVDSNSLNPNNGYYISFWDLQLGLDGNLYFLNGETSFQNSRKISRILCPDNIYQQISIEDTVLGPLGQVLGAQLPTLNQTLYVNTHKLQAQSQGDTVLCQGDSTELTAYGAATDDFYWSPSSGLSCTNCQSPMAAPDTTTTYRVIGIARSCAQDNVDTAYVTILVNPPKGQGSIQGDTVVCGTQPAVLLGPIGFDNYWWLQGFPGRVRTVYAADTYKLRISSKCYTDTLTHVVRYEDSLQYTFPNDTSICASDFPITLTAQSNFGVRINLAPQTQVTFTESNSAFFETSNHCTRASKTVRVDTIVLPSAMPDTSLPDSIAIGEQLNLPINGFALQSGELRSFSAGTTLQFGTVGEAQLFQVRGKGSCTDTVQLKSIVYFEPEVPEVENVPCEMGVSPNPGSESFELIANQELQNIGVYDTRGRAVYVSEEPQSTPISLFSERWAVGTYFIQATCKDETVLRIKWVKR